MNVLRQHRQRTLAEAEARTAAVRTPQGAVMGGAAPDGPAMSGSVYETMLAQLHAHKQELSAIDSRQTKAARKAEFIPDYDAYVEGVLAAGEAVQDDVVMTLFIWALDAHQFDMALEIADWALEHDLAPPPDFTRSVATILAEEVSETALDRLASDADDGPALVATLETVMAMLAEQDMPDEVRAKLNKAMGYAVRGTDPQDALEYLKTALSLNKKSGVKRDIETLERQLRKAAQTASPRAAPVTDVEAKAETPKANASVDGADRDGGPEDQTETKPETETETALDDGQ